MQNEEDQGRDHSKRITVALNSFNDKNLEEFVTTMWKFHHSMSLLRMLELPHGFLVVDPYLWEELCPAVADFRRAKETVKLLKVVNDHAERGVALIQEYCLEYYVWITMSGVDPMNNKFGYCCTNTMSSVQY